MDTPLPNAILQLVIHRCILTCQAHLLSPDRQNRIKEERRKKWDEAQRLALADATAALAAHERASSGGGKEGEQGSEAQRRAQKAELEGRVAYLKELQKNYEDCGGWLRAACVEFDRACSGSFAGTTV